MKPQTGEKYQHRKRGFERTASLLQHQIRRVGESRGFAVSRLVTHWAEIVGAESAAMAHPVKITYSQGGLGATLTVLTTGSMAPMLQADLPKIQKRANECYGYAAISRIRITQTAPVGFSEGRVAFDMGAAKPDTLPVADKNEMAAARVVAVNLAGDVADGSLRDALEKLGQNVLSKSTKKR